MTKRFPVNRGFRGFVSDDESFLAPDDVAGTDPWASDGHSTVGYDAKFDDGAGTRDYAGYGDGGATDNEAFLAPLWSGDTDYVPQFEDGSVSVEAFSLASHWRSRFRLGPSVRCCGIGMGPRYRCGVCGQNASPQGINSNRTRCCASVLGK